MKERIKDRTAAISSKYGDLLSGLNDLTAGQEPSRLFWLLADKLGYLLKNEPEAVLSAAGLARRQKIWPIIKSVGSNFLHNPQLLENRKLLRDGVQQPDDPIVIPDRPVIWAVRHEFKDDALASILAASRHGYILFGSLPQFYNTMDGVTAWLNGVVMVNRKVASSRQAVIEKAVRTMELGADMFIYPEGGLCKQPECLVCHLWPGIYRIAKATGAPVIPVIHYLREPTEAGRDNIIHTVVDDPIQIDSLPEKDALTLLRDTMATWVYLMMERYGHSTRAELQGKHNSLWDMWADHWIKMAGSFRYDREIELCTNYCPKGILFPEDVWQTVAGIEHITPANANHVAYAVNSLAGREYWNFQRRF